MDRLLFSISDYGAKAFLNTPVCLLLLISRKQTALHEIRFARLKAMQERIGRLFIILSGHQGRGCDICWVCRTERLYPQLCGLGCGAGDSYINFCASADSVIREAAGVQSSMRLVESCECSSRTHAGYTRPLRILPRRRSGTRCRSEYAVPERRCRHSASVSSPMVPILTGP